MKYVLRPVHCICSFYNKGKKRKTFDFILQKTLMANIFVYGSLLSKTLLETIVRRFPEGQQAALKGYSRLALKKRPYPGLVETSSLVIDNFPEQFHQQLQERGSVCESIRSGGVCLPDIDLVLGMVYFELTSDEISRLDAYEGDEYKKVKIDATLIPCGAVVPVQVYVWNGTSSDLFGIWDYQQFKREHLKSYVDAIQRCP